jgi:hypothetical protein
MQNWIRMGWSLEIQWCSITKFHCLFSRLSCTWNICSEKQSLAVENYVNGMLLGYCKTLSPFDLSIILLLAIDGEHDHLLALLYQLIMLPPDDTLMGSAGPLRSTILEVLGGLLTNLPGNIGTLIDLVIRVVLELPCFEIFQRKAQLKLRGTSWFLLRQNFAWLKWNWLAQCTTVQPLGLTVKEFHLSSLALNQGLTVIPR